MTTEIEADYLVVGAGATAMAFVDTLLAETDATVVMVDRHHQPGGHWTIAYPYVRLHQPSAMYGVNSRPLGDGTVDRVGGNAGHYELATAGEICGYFDQVMRQTFLPSGRVSYFPMAEYDGHGRFHLVASGARYQVRVRRRVVDTTYQRVSVPAMRAPEYPVAAEIPVIPPNRLADIREPYDRYVVVGAGKTGIDACLWLLDQGVDPAKLTWIMPRAPWLINRATIQPRPLQSPEELVHGFTAKHEAIMAADSVPDLFERLHAIGALLKIFDDDRPSNFRCATVSRAELAKLRRVEHVVRLGRVKRITDTRIELDGGDIPTGPRVLHVDCTADAAKRLPVVPIFTDRLITLQSVRVCQPVFSAALIAHVEAAYPNDTVKNELCPVTPNPNSDADWLRFAISGNDEQLRWAGNADIAAWLRSSRLQPDLAPPLPEDPAQRSAFEQQGYELARQQNAKLTALLAAHEAR